VLIRRYESNPSAVRIEPRSSGYGRADVLVLHPRLTVVCPGLPQAPLVLRRLQRSSPGCGIRDHRGTMLRW